MEKYLIKVIPLVAGVAAAAMVVGEAAAMKMKMKLLKRRTVFWTSA